MLAHLRLVPVDQTRCETPVESASPIRIRQGAALRDQLGGALRRLYDLNPREAMPAEFEALIRTIQNPTDDATA